MVLEWRFLEEYLVAVNFFVGVVEIIYLLYSTLFEICYYIPTREKSTCQYLNLQPEYDFSREIVCQWMNLLWDTRGIDRSKSP